MIISYNKTIYHTRLLPRNIIIRMMVDTKTCSNRQPYCIATSVTQQKPALIVYSETHLSQISITHRFHHALSNILSTSWIGTKDLSLHLRVTIHSHDLNNPNTSIKDAVLNLKNIKYKTIIIHCTYENSGRNQFTYQVKHDSTIVGWRG